MTTLAASCRSTAVSDASAIHAKAIDLGKHILRSTTAAGSGHPSSALALVHIVIELMYRRMHWDPKDPWNPGNDRLVLSLGHAVPVIYAAYADLGGTVGHDPKSAKTLSIDDLASLRELSSVLDGHPNPAEGFPFFDAATGSLGQGLSVAAGLALAARLDKNDKRIYCIIGDGESREGQIWEAADLIAERQLNNVCAIFSCNGHGQAGPVSSQQSAETIARKMEAFGWAAFRVNGHDPDALDAAFDRAASSEKPAALVAETVKGWGVDLMLGKNYHGKPLTDQELPKAIAELEATGRKLGAHPDKLGAPSPHERVMGATGGLTAGGGQSASRTMREAPIKIVPFEDGMRRAGLGSVLEKKKLATRRAYGAALMALGDADPRVVALDGDVSNSTFADMFAAKYPDRFIECKIAEQNMISAAAGMAAAGKIPFASSFGKFLARAADQIDMAAISRANIKIVGSHSGVSLGADGPSQMSVSDVAYFRSLTRVDNGRPEAPGPACRLFQPSDAVSAYALVELMANVGGMCYMRTHRPDAAFLYPVNEKFDLSGWKQLRQGKHLTLVSSGYMLHNLLRAAEELAKTGIESSVFDAYAFPLDCSAILDAARRTGGTILTVEDNYIGGLHAELAEGAAASGDVRVVGLTCKRIPKSAKTADEVFDYTGVGFDAILAKARELRL